MRVAERGSRVYKAGPLRSRTASAHRNQKRQDGPVLERREILTAAERITIIIIQSAHSEAPESTEPEPRGKIRSAKQRHHLRVRELL